MSTFDNDYKSESADRPARQVAADGSVDFDLETAKTNDPENISKDGSDIHHHARSKSSQKPSFKAVSVTKSFLAKAGAPLPPVNKPNDDKGKATLKDTLPIELSL